MATRKIQERARRHLGFGAASQESVKIIEAAIHKKRHQHALPRSE